MIGWPRTLRARLTLRYAFALAVVLVIYAAFVFVTLRNGLYEELDRRLADDFERAEEMLETDGSAGLRWRTAGHHAEDGPESRGFVLVWSSDGEVVYRRWPQGANLPEPPSDANEETGPLTVPTSQGAVRQLTRSYRIAGRDFRIRVARSEAGVRHELAELLLVMLLGLPVAVGLSGMSGWLLAAKALAPVAKMAERAHAIRAERLSERLPVENPDDELGRLGTVFNDTLARLERSFEALRRFTADAAHELRTPLTALRSVGEVGLREPKTQDECRDVIGSMLEEADRLTRLVDTLLNLSRADAGRIEVRRERLDLRRFAREMAEYLEAAAEEKGQQIVVEGAARVDALADPLLLRQAVLNVLDNAIQHAPDNAPIRLVVEESDEHAVLEVIDRGPGIEAEHLPHVFDRFYRADRARSRDGGGAGLGLAIAQWAVQANGGVIAVESRVGEGSRFRLRLPKARDRDTGGSTGSAS